jgi:hypothetical protein
VQGRADEAELAQHPELGQAAVGARGAVQPGRALQQRLRGLERLATQRHLRGALERAGRLTSGTHGGRLPQVLGHDLRGVVGVADRREDRLGRAQVQPRPAQ